MHINLIYLLFHHKNFHLFSFISINYSTIFCNNRLYIQQWPLLRLLKQLIIQY